MKKIIVPILIILLALIVVWFWNSDQPEVLDYDQLTRKAFEYNTEGDYQKAAEYYLKAAAVDQQGRHNAYRNAAIMSIRLREFERAEEYFTKAMEAKLGAPAVVYTELMDLYINDLKKSEEDIIATYEYFMSKVQNNRDIAVHYARYLESIKRYQDALGLYQAILEAEPDNQAIKQAIEFLQKRLTE